MFPVPGQLDSRKEYLAWNTMMRRSVRPSKCPGPGLSEKPWREHLQLLRELSLLAQNACCPLDHEMQAADSVRLARDRIVGRVLGTQDEGFPCSRKAAILLVLRRLPGPAGRARVLMAVVGDAGRDAHLF